MCSSEFAPDVQASSGKPPGVETSIPVETALPAQTERSIRERFAAAIGWNLLAIGALQGSAFAVNVMLANVLGKQHFGEFAIIQNTLVTLASIGQVATGITAAKFVAENRVYNKRVAGEIIGLCSVLTLVTGLLGTGLLIGFAPWISADVLHAPQLKSGLEIAAAASLFLTMNAFQIGALAGLEAFRAAAIVSGAIGLLHVALCGIGAWLFGMEGALWALLLSSFVRWVAFDRLLRSEALEQGVERSWAGWRAQRGILRTFAIPAAICGMSSMPSLWVANALIARQRHGYELLALYSAAFQLKSLVLLLPTMFNNVGMSLLNHQRGIGNAKGYRRVFWLNVAIGGGAAALGAVLMGALGIPLLQLYGGTFADAYAALLVLLCSAVFEGFATGAFQAVQSKGRMWPAFWFVVLPRDLLVVILALALVATYGLMGLASAYSIAWIFGSLLTFIYAFRSGLKLSGDRGQPGE
jgi:O-antigen/teichoic acid export membrane protein